MNTKNRLSIVFVIFFLHAFLMIQKRRALGKKYAEGAHRRIAYLVFLMIPFFSIIRQLAKRSGNT